MDTEYLQTMNLKLQDDSKIRSKDLNNSLGNQSLNDLESSDSSKDFKDRVQ